MPREQDPEINFNWISITTVLRGASAEDVETLVEKKYRHGFVTDIESDTVPPGLDEDVIRMISRRKQEPQFMLDWRLRAYRQWLEMKEPNWAHVHYSPIDFNDISYFSAPKSDKDRPKSLDEVDPKLLETCVQSLEKLGVDQLITIGGDDTAFSAMKLEEKAGGRIHVVHVPKTIDNDLQATAVTFGFNSAMQTVVDALQNLNEMRQAEGNSMALELKRQLQVIAELTQQVDQRAPIVVENYRERLLERMNRVLAEIDAKAEPADLHQ